MSLEAKVMEHLKIAMKEKNNVALRTLRSIKAALLEAKTAANAKPELSESDEMKLLQKMVKQRKDSMSIFQEQHREDLATKEAEEIAVLETFLPQQMNEEELQHQIQQIIRQTQASSLADMGKVMGMATKQLAGKADGASIARIVKELLA